MMPYGGPPLAQKEIATIRQWIDAGAPGPDSTAPLAAVKAPKHWSYVKPVRPALPQVKNAAWCRNPDRQFHPGAARTRRLAARARGAARARCCGACIWI